jgi:CubicO group peptidase (beta-lactamase class C family)
VPEPQHFAASPEEVGVDPRKLEALFARAEREVREGLLPSMQVAVARHGKLAGMRTLGRVSHGGRPAQADDRTLYVIFSCTKAVTSAAGWILLQEGKLALTERVADAIPEFAGNGKEAVKVEQLFTHTAGFPRAPLSPSAFFDRAARLERFARWRLNWEPGSRFEYHPTSSMWVIAELVERRSGLPLRDFVRSRICEPLGIELHVGLPPEHHPRVADIVHVGEPITPEEAARVGWPTLPETEVTEQALQAFNQPALREAGVPGGGGITTAGDLALFYQAILRDLEPHAGPRIWQAGTLRAALEPRTGDLRDPVFGVPANRALGVVVAGAAGRTARGFGHGGSPRAFGHNGAGGQIAWADPESGISFAWCTNGHDRNFWREARRNVGISSRAADLLL